MKKLLLVLLVLLALSAVSCQGDKTPSRWTRVFGEEREREHVISVLTVSDGGFVVLGAACHHSDTERGDVCRTYLLKTDEEGNELWNKSINEYQRGRITLSAFETTDKGFIIFGASRIEKRYTVLVIKADNKGNKLWSKTIETDIGQALSVTRASGGDFIIKGVTFAETGIEVIDADPEGNVLQRKTLDLAMDDPFFSGFVVTRMSDGGFAVAWSKSEGEFETSIYVKRIDGDGRNLWSRTLGEASRSERPGQILETPDGGIAIVGTTGPLGPPRTDRDVYIVRLEVDGSRLWENAYGSRSLIESPRSVAQTEDGGFVVVGERGPSDPLPPGNTYLMRIDEQGNEMWNRTFESGDSGSSASSVLQIPDGGFIVAGGVSRHLPDGMVNRDIFLMRIDSEGNYEPMR